MIRNIEARNILQGLFDKWNGKSEEVINEAKVEDVQTTIKVQPPKLYKLRFDKKTKGRRYVARFKQIYICTCYENQKEQVELDFNKYKSGGYSTTETIEALRQKYTIQAPCKEEYFFRKNGNVKNTIMFYHKIDGKLQYICSCKNNPKTKEKVLKHCKELISDGKSLEEICVIMRPLYSSNKVATQKHLKQIPKKVEEEKESKPLEWSDKGELLFNGLHSGLLPSNVAMIQTLHANHSNPFIFADYVCQNLPEARPSVINYICMNYDEIPFNDLIQEGMEIMDKQRGF